MTRERLSMQIQELRQTDVYNQGEAQQDTGDHQAQGIS